MELRILQSGDAEVISAYGRAKMAVDHADPMELEMASWTAPWRAESLAHYLKLGWSFAAHQSQAPNQILGFALAQPFLFVRAQTQSLWVETVMADSEEIRVALIETLYKWAKDKHLQKLILSSHISLAGISLAHSKAEGDWQIATSRSRT